MQDLPTITLNNYFTTINITFFFAGGAVGVILTLVTKLGEKFIDECFDKRKEKRKRKQELARKIIAVCSEGSLTGYNAMPSSQEQVQLIALQVEGLNKSIADDLRTYLGLWFICAVRQNPGPHENKNPSLLDIESCRNLQKRAKFLESLILKRVRKWE